MLVRVCVHFKCTTLVYTKCTTGRLFSELKMIKILIVEKFFVIILISK